MTECKQRTEEVGKRNGERKSEERIKMSIVKDRKKLPK